MQIRKNTPAGRNAIIICLARTEERLAGTCFRGKEKKLAGNFHLWESAEDVFADESVSTALAEEIDDLVENQDFGTHSVTVTHSADVGWESTDNFPLFNSDELEEFYPNNRSHALRVINPSKLGRKAPRASEVTFVFNLAMQRGELKVTIVSLYPGIDVGELVDDITTREQRVFYDWEHPGI